MHVLATIPPFFFEKSFLIPFSDYMGLDELWAPYHTHKDLPRKFKGKGKEGTVESHIIL